MQRLSDLEQQLQHEREKNETLLSSQDRNDQSSHLMKKIEELMVQQERCNMLLIQKVKLFMKENSDFRKRWKKRTLTSRCHFRIGKSRH